MVIVTQLNRRGQPNFIRDVDLRRNGGEQNLNNPFVAGLIRGDAKIIGRDARLVEALADADAARILPAHTLTVSVVNGVDRPRRG